MRISPAVLEAMQRWADDDLRSVNAQIEYVLREALRKSGRLKAGQAAPVADDQDDPT
nr:MULTISPECIES: Arc family DNA binding domain-containing protein [unclassified Dyella]